MGAAQSGGIANLFGSDAKQEKPKGLSNIEEVEMNFYQILVDEFPEDYMSPEFSARMAYLRDKRAGKDIAIKDVPMRPFSDNIIIAHDGKEVEFRLTENGANAVSNFTIHEKKGVKGELAGGPPQVNRALCYGSMYPDLRESICGGECTDEHIKALEENWKMEGEKKGLIYCWKEENKSVTEGYMLPREYLRGISNVRKSECDSPNLQLDMDSRINKLLGKKSATKMVNKARKKAGCPPLGEAKGSIGDSIGDGLSEGRAVGNVTGSIGGLGEVHKAVLCYGNRHKDLMDAMCGGNVCTEPEQADKLMDHWMNHGHKEDRVWCYKGLEAPPVPQDPVKEVKDTVKNEGYLFPQEKMTGCGDGVVGYTPF